MKNPLIAPEYELPPSLKSADLVTAIRVYGSHGEHPLPVSEETFLVGSSSSCDVRLANEYISAKHCQLTRQDQRLRVTDLGSHNATFFRGHKETTFDISPGDIFIVATTRLLALNEGMRLARPILTEILGFDQESAIDDILIASTLDSPILIAGPRGGQQMVVSQEIHKLSTRRSQSLVEIVEPSDTFRRQKELVDESRRGTLVVHATGQEFNEEFLRAVRHPQHGARLVVLAPSFRVAARSIGVGRLTPMSRIDIRPLRERPGEIAKLLDLHLERSGSTFRLTNLSRENQEVLLHHSWPDNLEELRQTAEMIAELLRQGSIRQASEALKIPRSTVQYRIKQLQLSFPLRSSEAGFRAPTAPEAAEILA